MCRLLGYIENIILCLIFILNLGTVYFALCYNQFALLSMIVLILILVLSLLQHNVKITGKLAAILMIYSLYFIPYAFWSSAGSGILLFCSFIPTIVLLYHSYTKLKKINTVLNTYINCVIILGLVSVCFWVLGSILHILSPSGSVPLMWTGKNTFVSTYYYLYFEPQRNNLNIFGFLINMKNCGIFAEAPMASCAYSSALLANAYINPNKNFKSYIIIILILTTQSTTGIIIVVGYVLMLLYSKRMNNILGAFLKLIVTLVVSLIGIYIVWTLVQMKLATGSGEVRSVKIAEEFKAFLQSPIYGNGFNKYTNGSSNSITSILADGGIILFVFYYFPVIASIIRYRHKKNISFLLVLYLMLVSITCVITTYLMSGFTVVLWLNLIKKERNEVTATGNNLLLLER